jgi:hypothetical protein
MMRRLNKLTILACLTLGLLLPAAAVGAQENLLDPICTTTPEATACKDNQKEQKLEDNSLFGPRGIITKAARLVAVVVGIAAVIMIIVGGIQYVMSSGDPTNVTNAKNTIMYAIIGLVVALLAQGIIAFVLEKL